MVKNPKIVPTTLTLDQTCAIADYMESKQGTFANNLFDFMEREHARNQSLSGRGLDSDKGTMDALNDLSYFNKVLGIKTITVVNGDGVFFEV